MDTQPFLTAGDAARYLGVSRSTLLDRTRAGLLTRHKLDVDRRCSYYSRAELDALRTPHAA